ncbi:MAG: DUF3553 domain-containing protein [Proteobacteria bacterium]|nr:DUF3553 domain-containing protein [Pseudomonadota bacterium]
MVALLRQGEAVKHNKMAEWGIGKIIAVNSCGTIKVIFEGTKEVSIAKGSKYLTKINDNEENCVQEPGTIIPEK